VNTKKIVEHTVKYDGGRGLAVGGRTGDHNLGQRGNKQGPNLQAVQIKEQKNPYSPGLREKSRTAYLEENGKGLERQGIREVR